MEHDAGLSIMGSPANSSPKLPPLGSNCALSSHNGPNALDAFMFEGVRPHVVPNKAKGNADPGAVRYGHFYAVVEKIGSLYLGKGILA